MDFDQTRTGLNGKFFFAQENYLVENNNNVNKREFYQPRPTSLTSFSFSFDTPALVGILYKCNVIYL